MMGHIGIGADRALRGFPEQVNEIIVKMRKGRSKNKDAAPEELSYSMQWCERIEASGKADEEREARESQSLEDRVSRRLRNIRVVIEGRIGKGRWSSGVLDEVPKQIAEMVRETEQSNQAERERIAALSPEEREAETEDILQQLRGSPGFTEIRLLGG